MSKGQNALNEERTAAASYIISFYENVGYLTHHLAVYHNLMIELENKYKEVDIKGLEEIEGQLLQQQLQQLRYFAHKSIIQYKSIIDNLQLNSDPNLLELYEKVKKDYIINRQDIDNFVLILNKLLVKEVMKNILENSQDIIHSLYNE